MSIKNNFFKKGIDKSKIMGIIKTVIITTFGVIQI